MADPMTLADPDMPWFSVKEAVMPFARFPWRRYDPGPRNALDRRSHGLGPQLPPRLPEGPDWAPAWCCPPRGCAFISIKDADKTAEQMLGGRAKVLTEQGLPTGCHPWHAKLAGQQRRAM